MKNCYHILGLESNSTQEEIKQAFKVNAKHFHPDKHEGNEFFANKFIEIKEAYEILSDAHQKKAHDDYHGLNQSPSSNYNQESDSDYSSKSSNSESFDSSKSYSQTVTEEHYYHWAEQKAENNDYLGALELIGEGMKKFPKSGLLDFAEGQVQESFGFYVRALKSYKKAFNGGIIPAKDAMIKLESILNNAIEIVKKHQINGILFCIVGIVITIIGNAVGNLAMGAIAGTIINLIGSILITRRSFNELPKNLIDSLGNYSFETNLFGILVVLFALGSSALTAMFIN